jgi:hypothetical protein
MILTFILTCLFAVSAVSAAENVTDDIISADASNDVVSAGISDDVVSVEETTDEVVSVENDNQVITEENNVINEEDNGTFAALQQKIDNAGDNSTIIFANNYTYDDEFTANGILINKSLTIDGKGYTINANHQARIFNITAGNVTLKNINFINGNASYGGAINAEMDTLTIIDSNFTNNNAFEVDEGGGAINFDGTSLTIINSKFIANTANNGQSSGGAISFVGTDGLMINESEFIGNSAGCDGAISVFQSNAIISNSRFENNKAGSEVGAISFWDDDNMVDNCYFINNSADSIAAIFNGGDNLKINNSHFISNSANRIGTIRNSQANTIILSNNEFRDNAVNSIDNNYGSLYLYNNDINKYSSEIRNYGGDITSQVTITILDNKTLYKHLNENVLVYLTFCDDNGNLIYIDGFEDFNLLVNNTKINYIYSDMNQQYEGNFTADEIGSYPVTISNVHLSNLTVETGEINIMNITNDFSTLNQLIGNCNGTLTLTKDYIFNPLTDHDFDMGILIWKNITIDGAGYTLDGNNQSSIFYVDSDNVVLKNITFINGNYDGEGGAIYW